MLFLGGDIQSWGKQLFEIENRNEYFYYDK